MTKRKPDIIAILILGLALILRLPLLNGSFWLDEAAQALESVRPLSEQLNIMYDFQPPLLHIILHFASYFGISEWWLRTIGALIPGLITIYFTIKIGQKLFNKQIGYLAGLLLAINSFHIFYSQELRPYSLPAMWAILSWWQLINWEKIKTDFKLKTSYIIFSVLGLYSSYLYPFILISQFLYLAFTKITNWKKWLPSFLIISLLFLPWLPSFLTQLKVGQELRVQMPNWETVVSLTQFKALPLVFGKFFYGLIDLEVNLNFVFLPLIIALIWLIKVGQKLKKDKKIRSAYFTLLFWLIIPLATVWLVSFFIPILRPKRVLALLPAFELLLVAGLYQPLKKLKSKKNPSLVFLASIFIIQLITTRNYYFKPRLQRENWRGLAQEIRQKFSPATTAVVFSFSDPFSPWQWYVGQEYPTLSTGSYLVIEKSQLNEQLRTIAHYDTLLLFDYLRDLTDPNDLLPQELKNLGYQEIGALDYPHIGFVRIYTKNSYRI